MERRCLWLSKKRRKPPLLNGPATGRERERFDPDRRDDGPALSAHQVEPLVLVRRDEGVVFAQRLEIAALLAVNIPRHIVCLYHARP